MGPAYADNQRTTGRIRALGALGAFGTCTLLAITGGHVTAAPSPAPMAQIEVVGTVRDFKDTHPDFEHYLGDDRGIVLPDLGADKKPVYAGRSDNPTTTSKEAFDQWYRDVPGVNLGKDLTLVATGGGTPGEEIYTYNDQSFFPIDRQLFGNQG